MPDPDRTRNVMLRFTEAEAERLNVAYAAAQRTGGWRDRLPFAAWLRRTVMNLFPAPAAPEPKPATPRKLRRVK